MSVPAATHSRTRTPARSRRLRDLLTYSFLCIQSRPSFSFTQKVSFGLMHSKIFPRLLSARRVSFYLSLSLSPLFFSLPFAPLTEYLPRLDSHMFQDFFVSTDRSEGNLHPERLSPPDEWETPVFAAFFVVVLSDDIEFMPANVKNPTGL